LQLVLPFCAFDISVKPMLDAYRAGQPGMALTLDGIAKGRVVDGAVALLQRQGFDNILVEAGGDLMALGGRVDGTPWRVGIHHPRRLEGTVLGRLPVSQQAVATSGG
jgi:FAD:protein FMN transferase